MKQASATMLKRGERVVDSPPTEGTKIRAAFDALKASPGKPVDLTMPSVTATQLNDTYGLDVRYFGKGRWCLVGELDLAGRYIDYMVPA